MRDQPEILEEILQEQRIANALLRALASKELDALLQGLADDPIDAAVIRALMDGEESAGILTAAVAKGARVTERAVRTHVAQLISDGIIQRLGAGTQTDYRLTGLFSSGQLRRLRA